MSSLSTVYAITTVLSSIAGMGAAFIGNRIFPLKGGSRPPPPTPAEVEDATRIAADKAQKLAAAEEFEKETPDLVQTPPETPPELVQTPPETPPELVQTPPAVPEAVPEPIKLAPENPEDLPEPVPESVPEPVKLAPENPEDLPEPVPESVTEPVKLAPENPEEPPENPEDEMPIQAAKGRKKRYHK
jgi:hypothetical protein